MSIVYQIKTAYDNQFNFEQEQAVFTEKFVDLFLERVRIFNKIARSHKFKDVEFPDEYFWVTTANELRLKKERVKVGFKDSLVYPQGSDPRPVNSFVYKNIVFTVNNKVSGAIKPKEIADSNRYVDIIVPVFRLEGSDRDFAREVRLAFNRKLAGAVDKKLTEDKKKLVELQKQLDELTTNIAVSENKLKAVEAYVHKKTNRTMEINQKRRRNEYLFNPGRLC